MTSSWVSLSTLNNSKVSRFYKWKVAAVILSDFDVDFHVCVQGRHIYIHCRLEEWVGRLLGRACRSVVGKRLCAGSLNCPPARGESLQTPEVFEPLQGKIASYCMWPHFASSRTVQTFLRNPQTRWRWNKFIRFRNIVQKLCGNSFSTFFGVEA